MLSDGNARAVFAWLAPAYWISGNSCPSTARLSNRMANTDVLTLIIASPTLIICAHSNLTFLLVKKKSFITYLLVPLPQTMHKILITSLLQAQYLTGT